MTETWVLKTYDGEVYNLNTEAAELNYDTVYNLLQGVTGHHGMPVTILSDVVVSIAGAETRQVLRGIRTVYLPLYIRGKDPQDFHKNLEKLRRSLDPMHECQLWVTNEEGETRVLYCRYSKGFENAVDDDKRQASWMNVPLYVEADDPYFYDPPGAEVTRIILSNPFAAEFLTPTVVLQSLTADAVATSFVLYVDSVEYFVAGQSVEIISGAADYTHYETCVIDSVDLTANTITLKGYLRDDFLVADGAYVQVVDDTEIFVSTDADGRVLNEGCNYVIFWMRGCPPCITALNQLADMQKANPNITVTKVEIQDADASEQGIGMTAAKILYPEAYEFATNCGPPPAAGYQVIDGIMPAVIALYRKGAFIQAWCGVHTTQVDPIATNELEDACGPRVAWRIGKKYLGDNIIVENKGDAIAYPVWTISGPGSSLHLANVTTGDEFLLDHDIIPGETVVVDSRESAHTCGSTNQADFQGTGYWATETCPTCKGTGVVLGCATCGVYEVCPTCHGTKTIQVWIPSASGSIADAAGMFNLRPQIDVNKRVFWGLTPGPNVIKVELTGADLTNTSVHFTMVQRYEGM
jgi:thiol-disulfide isomerase/thioredoxin